MSKQKFSSDKAARGTGLHVVAVGLAAVACVLVLYMAQPQLAQLFDLKIYDELLPLRQLDQHSQIPVIVDIDEESLARYGQWPWPRYLVAELLDKLEAGGAAAVGLDIMFAEEDRSSPRVLHQYLKRDKGVDIVVQDLPEELWDYDTLLARVLAGKNVVLGFYARFTDTPATRTLPPGVGIAAREKPGAVPFDQQLKTASDAVLPLPVMQEQAPVGFINVAAGLDGVIRRVMLLVGLDGKVYPSLALRTLMQAMHQDSLVVFSGSDGLESIRLGNYVIPVTPEGFMLVPFQGGAKTYAYISAGDVLAGTVDQAALRNKIVFVGTSAPGLVDIRATPFARVLPGVEVHAAVLDAILSQNFITAPPWTPGAQMLAIAFFGAVAAAAFGLARPRVYIPVALLLLASPVLVSIRMFMEGIFISPLYVMLTVLAQGVVLLFLRFIQEERQKLVLRNAFSHYVSPEVVSRITHLRGNLFAGEERELSILFTDIRGFTSISEKLSPQQVVSLLNRYFTPMTALVRDNQGTLDKFMGDALMAFWNAPLDVPEHAKLAVSSALSMQESLGALNSELREEFGVEIRIGVGVHTGSAYVGNMGSDDLVNYTLIGDNVNLASRLEGLCPMYGAPIIVSESTMLQCGDAFAFQYVDTLRVKGKQQPVTIYLPMPTAEYAQRLEEIRAWDAARELYGGGHFISALSAFEELQKRFPGVRLYAFYAERTRGLAASPPAAWDGIWSLGSSAAPPTAVSARAV